MNFEFKIQYEPKFLTKLCEKLNFENTPKDVTTPPLFTLKEADNDQLMKNMRLIKLSVKCDVCDYELRIGEAHLDKALRQRKALKTDSAKEHYDKTKHTMTVKQLYKEYRGKI